MADFLVSVCLFCSTDVLIIKKLYEKNNFSEQIFIEVTCNYILKY